MFINHDENKEQFSRLYLLSRRKLYAVLPFIYEIILIRRTTCESSRSYDLMRSVKN